MPDEPTTHKGMVRCAPGRVLICVSPAGVEALDIVARALDAARRALRPLECGQEKIMVRDGATLVDFECDDSLTAGAAAKASLRTRCTLERRIGRETDELPPLDETQ